MKAIVFTKYGSPDDLELKEVPKPTPKDDELLISVRASSINSWDWEFLNGVPFINRLMFGLLKPKPGKQILGADIAGTVETVGRRVTRFQPGDEVFGDLWDSFGGFADYACAHETAVELKPVNATFEEAAAVPQAGVLALQGFRKAGQMQPGQRVLINGAGGGVGTFAIQLAKLSGTDVTGVDAAHKLDIIRSAGADHVIDYSQEDFTKTEIRGAFSLFKPFDPAMTPAPGDNGGEWAEIEALALPDEVQLKEEGKLGNPVVGREAFKMHCRGCHAPADLASHLFGEDRPADKPSLCKILETHGLTDAARDCDIVAFLQVLAEADVAQDRR